MVSYKSMVAGSPTMSFRCMEDLGSTTRNVTPQKVCYGRQSYICCSTVLHGSAANEKHGSQPSADVKLSRLASGIDSSSAVQITETRRADLLDRTLWNRRPALSSERIVCALVQQIFLGIREYFLASA
ncbi:hypothetical protein POTOM_056871 [Populus tomentosa]|uniref:Uncharacterized protein n=1 Tax=Populus tomentosa TaxID=118781 RepID=A0A8X8C3D7_POPTO|nr:hypothetical protein POTOM_056871 [Populus tomentosa]